MEREESEVRKTIHDLNNMLAAVLGSAELIVGDTQDGTQIHQDAQNIRSAALRGRELIDTLRGQISLT
jgi:hypothetical protein